MDEQIMGEQFIYDLCIVGAGMFGSAAARHASTDPSIKVCLVGPAEPTTPEERSRRSFFGAHYDEGRITRVLDAVPACQILAKHSIGRLRELEEVSGMSFYNPVGCIFMGGKNSNYMTEIDLAGRAEKVPLVYYHDENELRTKYPYLRMKNDECAILDENGAGYISPRKLVIAQKKVAKSQGCDVIENEVKEIISHSIHEVKTVSKGTIHAKKILIATGAFTGFIHVDDLKPIALERLRRTVALLHISKEEAEKLRSMPSVIRHDERLVGAYILPPIKYPDGEYYIKFGPSGKLKNEEINSLEEMKEWYLLNGNEDLLKTHLKFVTELFPKIKLSNVETMSCACCYSLSGLPYIDKISPTVTVACAGNGKGAKFSDEVGRIAAKLSLTGEWDSEIPKEKFKVIFQ
ncbi:hypothetical protein JTE90_000442 [Oedothorax gibbosus]|uniref:FAD dependent oxidoreductase domain-containing protein n=1 Tax=Oedothorax gibbosus TaxID=931172 RepID=A0AAV6UEK2_9ARAC|nr:hypothetical protein JTE90_000442 [Oedothorax gibbosus]